MAETDLTIKFKVQDDGSVHLENFSNKLAKIPKHVDSMNASLKLISFSSLVNLGEAAYNVGERIYGMAKETASALNDIERSAKVANMTTTQYQLMAYAAKMSDVSIEELSTGMKKLSVNMDEAQKAGGPAAEKFERIGVSVKDSSGKMKELNQIMLELAEKFSTWEDGPRKIAIAVDLFGRSGERLIPYLNQGAAGIKKFYEEAERLGIVLDEKLIKKGSELEDSFKRAGSMFDAYWKRIVIGAYDAIKATEDLGAKLKSIPDLLGSPGKWLYEKITGQVVGGIESAKEIVARVEKAGMVVPAYTAMKEAPATPVDNRERDRKILLEVNLQLLKDQESTVKRIIELQEKLNKANDDAVKIMENLGIGTKAALTQWINEDIVGEYGKLLGSKLFSTEELELAKGKFIEALEAAETGGWGAEFRQIEEAINKIKEMKIEDTEVQRVRSELSDLKKYLEYLDKFTSVIKIDDSQLVAARAEVSALQMQLAELAIQRFTADVSLTGSGSTQKPIMEKIDEIYGGFENMQSFIANMKANVEMEQISGEIARYQGLIGSASRAPHTIGYGERVAQNWIPYYQSQIRALDEQKRLLTSAKTAYAEPAPEGAAPTQAGIGEGGISININTINVAAAVESVAETLDGELADLWNADRSRLKEAIRK